MTCTCGDGSAEEDRGAVLACPVHGIAPSPLAIPNWEIIALGLSAVLAVLGVVLLLLGLNTLSVIGSAAAVAVMIAAIANQHRRYHRWLKQRPPIPGTSLHGFRWRR